VSGLFPDRDRKIAEAYSGGRTLRELAADFDISHERVRQILEREGVKLRSRSPVWPDCPAHLLEDYRTLRAHMPAREARAALDPSFSA
jgi:hypothetical protein